MPTVAINTTAAAPTTVTPRSATAPTAATAQGADSASFANQLSQAQLSADDGSTARATPNPNGADAAPSHPSDAKATDGAGKPDHDDGERSGKTKADKGAKPGPHRADGDAANAAPQAVWPPATPPATADAAKTARPADAKDGDAKGAGRAEKALARRLQAGEAAAPSPHHAAAGAADAKNGFQAALAAAGSHDGVAKDKGELRASSSETGASPLDAALNALGGSAATAPTLSADAGAAAAPATPAGFDAQLSAALGSPEFMPALGVQLSVLAREGVQQARLHLNPAEMGPISVQIAVDGSTAVVHFQADVAATRQALEAGLPDLAAAMRDSGFTLSGGSVSQQQQQPSSSGNGRDGERGDGRGVGALGRAGGPANDAATATAVTRLSAPAAARLRGGIDLFA